MAGYIESEALQKQIAEIKRSIQSENREFLTGYISALSVVEGMIESLKEDEQTTIKRNDMEYNDLTLGVGW